MAWPALRSEHHAGRKALCLSSSVSLLSPALKSLAVLIVADVFHPIDVLAADRFLNCDMRHGGGGRCAVPVLFASREPHDVAGPNFFNRPALRLHPTESRRDHE